MIFMRLLVRPNIRKNIIGGELKLLKVERTLEH